MKHLTNIDLSQNQLLNGVVQNLATAPATPVAGQIYYNTTDNRLFVYNGTEWVGADSIGASMTGANIVTAINGSTSIIDLDNLPAGVATAVSQAHSSHTIATVTGLQAALDGKVDDAQVLTNVPVGALFTDTVTTINGKTGAIAKADIVALGIPASDTNTTYANATTSVAGLMSTTDKTKLDGIATGANNYALPVAGASVLGGVKSGTDITVDASGNVSVADNSHSHTSANISDATNLNTINTIVKRDASGNFSAGTITASLAGNATSATTAATTTGNAGTATALQTARTIDIDGDITATAVAFDGTSNITITATVNDDSHNHIISNVDGLQAALDAKIATSAKGAANGVASLDANGFVPSSQLPSYVDDIIESATFATLPATGETGKIYVDLATNVTYRWSGTAYVEISKSIALGTTAGTAYAGDAGTTLASNLSAHTANTSNPHGVTKAQIGLTNVDNTADAAKNVLTATKLFTARTITLGGDLGGSVSFDGSANVTINASVTDGSHNHSLANVTDVTASAAEVNVLDGILASTAELNYVDGVTSNIQTQLNARTRKYATNIGDGTATSIVVTHNLNTQDAVVSIREVATPYAQVITDVEYTSANTITVKFGAAPTAGQYRVTVIG